MSTDLYGVRVEAVEGDAAFVRVFLLYDNFHVPYAQSMEFFMGILVKTLHPTHLPQIGHFPLAQELYKAVIPNHLAYKTKKHYLDCLERYKMFAYPEQNNRLAQHYIRSVEEVTRTFPPDDAPTYTFNYLHNGTFGYDETQLEQALFFMQTTDEKWLQHWQQGLTFATTCYAL